MAQNTPITVVGNLTADPELKALPNGDSVLNFSVASSTRVFNKETNSWTDGEASFFRVTAWRQLAEHIAASARKGQELIVVGTISQRSYTTAQGENRSSFEIEADSVGVSLKWGAAAFQPRQAQAAPAPAQVASPQAAVPVAAPVVAAGVPQVPAGFEPVAAPVAVPAGGLPPLTF